MQGICTYIPETNCAPREYIVLAILLLLFMVRIIIIIIIIIMRGALGLRSVLLGVRVTWPGVRWEAISVWFWNDAV